MEKQIEKTIKKIALVDDELLFRRVLGEILKQHNWHICFEAGDGWEMTQKLRADDLPDVLLLDLAMPKMDGVQSLRWLRTNYPDIPVWILSSLPVQLTEKALMREGASGYLEKTSPLNGLIEKIESILSDTQYNSL